MNAFLELRLFQLSDDSGLVIRIILNLLPSFSNNKSCPQWALKVIKLAFTLTSTILVPQVLLGWKYGDCVDEKAKIHPQLRTYKALTEKVKNISFVKRMKMH